MMRRVSLFLATFVALLVCSVTEGRSLLRSGSSSNNNQKNDLNDESVKTTALQFILVDTNTGLDLQTLSVGDIVDMSASTSASTAATADSSSSRNENKNNHFSIRVEVPFAHDVLFTYTDDADNMTKLQYQGSEPFAMRGTTTTTTVVSGGDDDDDEYNNNNKVILQYRSVPYLSVVGLKRVTVSAKSATGALVAEDTIEFTMVDTTSTSSTTSDALILALEDTELETVKN